MNPAVFSVAICAAALAGMWVSRLAVRTGHMPAAGGWALAALFGFVFLGELWIAFA